MPDKSIRTFIALEISEAIKEEITKIQDEIKQSNSISGKWVLKDNMHLTLKFLGDTPLDKVKKVKEAIQDCFREDNLINCNVAKVGVFPNDRFARVIWVGIEKGDIEIINLAKKIEKILSKLGFKKEKKDFKTHITICRPKQILDRNHFQLILEKINNSFQPKEFVINKIIFFESRLTPQGPIYTPLSSICLQ